MDSINGRDCGRWAWPGFSSRSADRRPDDRPGLARFEFGRDAHGQSRFKLVLYTSDESDRCQTRLACRIRPDRGPEPLALSDYDPESELMRLCDRSGGPAVRRLGDDLFDILARDRSAIVRAQLEWGLRRDGGPRWSGSGVAPAANGKMPEAETA